jgi:hypothetical protein
MPGHGIRSEAKNSDKNCFAVELCKYDGPGVMSYGIDSTNEQTIKCWH